MQGKGGGRRRAARACVAALIAAALPSAIASPASAAPNCSFNGQPGPLLDVTPVSVIAVTCSGLEPNQQLVVNEESPLAAVVEPATSAPFEAGADLGSPVTADADGNLNVGFIIPAQFHALDPAAVCPPTQEQVDAGLTNCVLTIRDAASVSPVTSPASLVYRNQPAPTGTPTASIMNGASFVDGNVVTFTGTGFWASATGTPPAVLFGTTPAATLDGSPVAISKPSYICSTDCNGVAGTLISGGQLSGNVIVPAGLPGGTTMVTVVQPNSTPFPSSGPFGALTAATSVNLLGPPVATASPSSGGPGTSVHVTGTGWDPQGPMPVLSFLTSIGAPGTSATATAYLDLNGNITAELVVDATAAPGVNPIVVTQGLRTAQAAYTVTDTVSTCQPDTCSDNHVITQDVVAGQLSISQQSFDIALNPVSLTGASQHSSGQLNPITVVDSRGTLVGWTVTATLQGDFHNETGTGQSVNNTIPANNLTWTPGVALAANGSGIIEQVRPGDPVALSTTAGTTLCSAPTGGGGGSYLCSAAFDLLIPGSVAVGSYSAVLNVTIT